MVRAEGSLPSVSRGHGAVLFLFDLALLIPLLLGEFLLAFLFSCRFVGYRLFQRGRGGSNAPSHTALTLKTPRTHCPA
jgi:hypothetical protein